MNIDRYDVIKVLIYAALLVEIILVFLIILYRILIELQESVLRTTVLQLKRQTPTTIIFTTYSFQLTHIRWMDSNHRSVLAVITDGYKFCSYLILRQQNFAYNTRNAILCLPLRDFILSTKTGLLEITV